MSEPWERRADETARAFSAFCAYRDLLPRNRSLVAAAAVHYQVAPDGVGTAKERRVEKWSSTHAWVERVSLYDDHVDRLRRSASELVTIDMAERHARIALTVQTIALEYLEQLVTDPARIGAMRIRDVVYVALEATKLEREARGALDSVTSGEELSEQDAAREVLEGDPEVLEAHLNLLEAIANARDRVSEPEPPWTLSAS